MFLAVNFSKNLIINNTASITLKLIYNYKNRSGDHYMHRTRGDLQKHTTKKMKYKVFQKITVSNSKISSERKVPQYEVTL